MSMFSIFAPKKPETKWEKFKKNAAKFSQAANEFADSLSIDTISKNNFRDFLAYLSRRGEFDLLPKVTKFAKAQSWGLNPREDVRALIKKNDHFDKVVRDFCKNRK